MQSDQSWYTNRRSAAEPIEDAAQSAYREALDIFRTTLSKDDKKHVFAAQATTMSELQDIISQTQSTYETKHRGGKASKWLTRFNGLVLYYGNIMDVLVQHHPEYVSLAWGMMKLLFVGIGNHETMLASLVKTLCRVANALPRTEFALVLYPTDRVRSAAASLYANIIRFLVRAHLWFQESRLQHILHSITRPAELRTADLIQAIEAGTRELESLTQAGSQAEVRDIHLELQRFQSQQASMDQKYDVQIQALQSLRELVLAHHVQLTGWHIDTSSRLSDLQRSQILAHLSGSSVYKAEDALRWSVSLRNVRRRNAGNTPAPPFWDDQAFCRWNNSPTSAAIVIRMGQIVKGRVQDVFVDAIQQLQKAQQPILWLLSMSNNQKGTTTAAAAPAAAPAAAAASLNDTDLLKTLALQALQLNTHLHEEKQTTLSATRFQTATTVEDYFALLGSVLEALPRVYMVIDLDMLGGEDAALLAPRFVRFFDELSRRASTTVVKVVFLVARPMKCSMSPMVPATDGRLHQVSIAARAAKPTKAMAYRGRRGFGSPRGRGGLWT